MVVAGIIAFIIIAIIAVRMIVTAINSRSQRAMAEEETQGYTMVDSTELGEDGKPLQVPVPDGFTASQVPGETTVNGGFVIYEGEVDWSKIEDLSSYAEVETQELINKEEDNVSTESINLDENTDSNTNSENNNTAENENSPSNIEGEGANTEANNVNTNASEENNTTAKKEAENNIESPDKTKSTEIEKTEKEQEETKNIEETTETEEIGEELKEENSQEEQEKEKTNEEETLNSENTEIVTMSEEENGGITTLAEGETPTTVFELQTSRNQYVWVPVKDVSRIYGIDSKGKLWGKLYSGVSKTATARSPQSSDWSESNGIMRIKDKTGYREPDVVAYLINTNMNYRYDKDSELQNYRDGIEQYQMLSQEMEESYYKMIESVKKYGGFYIGRYETGDLNQEKAVVKKMNTDINKATWYEMYELCKEQEGEKENIETGMIWGSLWDETLQWLLETGAQIQNGEGGTREITESDINSNSSDWGNYNNATFEYRTTSGGTSTKNEGSSARIPTGSAEYTKANNIYDLAGNMFDWTLEAYSTDYRVLRGSCCYGGNVPASDRSNYSPDYSNDFYGCRSALYIK